MSFEEMESQNNTDSCEKISPNFEEQKAVCILKTYQDGFNEGQMYAWHVEDKKKIITEYSKILDVLVTIEKSLLNLEEIEKTKIENFKKEVGQTVKVCLNILFPYMKKELNAHNVIKLIDKTINSLKKKFKITAYISIEDREKILELFKNNLEYLEIVFKADLPSGNCMLSWDGGGAFWNPDIVHEKINAILTDTHDEYANHNIPVAK
jgi:flagellar biosynthesis/type III secretory pathway protein FliH